MVYKIDFHKVSEKQVNKGKMLNASFQAKVWVAQKREKKIKKDRAYREVFAQMKEKYPEFTDEERKDMILRYL